jgi:hypothetical protein
VRVAPPDDYSVPLEWAAADSVPDDCSAPPQAGDQSAPVALPDDCWVAPPVDDRSVRAAPLDDCSVRLEWAAADSVLDGCSAAPQAGDHFALVALVLTDDYWVEQPVDDHFVQAVPQDDCSVRLEWAAADSVPEDSVQDDCWAAQWADDHFAAAVLPDDYWVAADLDDSAPPDYSVDSLQADYWVAPPADDRCGPVAARDDSRVQMDLDDYYLPAD